MKEQTNHKRSPFYYAVSYAMAACMLGLLFINYWFGNRNPTSELPTAVVIAIQNKFPGADLINAEHREHYAVKIRVGQRRNKVDISPEGVIYQIRSDGDDFRKD